MIIHVNLEDESNRYKIESLIKTFYKTVRFKRSVVTSNNFNIKVKDGEIIASLEIEGKQVKSNKKIVNFDDLQYETLLVTYELLCKITSSKPKWGMVIGVRPVKLALNLLNSGVSRIEIIKYLTSRFDLSIKKANLLLDIAIVQMKVKTKENKRDFHLYISIPFCSSRCKYCSFVSQDIKNQSGLISDYLNLLKKELLLVKNIMNKYKLNLLTIYIGGGTPTSINCSDLLGLLKFIDENFSASNVTEYTVEAGRVDSLSEEKLRIIKENKVNRICLNPQTFTEEALVAVGRPFDEKEFLKTYNYAKEIGFDVVNMDFIAGLEKETINSFEETIRKAVELKPANITVHGLTLKRGSNLYGEEIVSNSLANMIKSSQQILIQSGYIPYYLYRQKNMVESLENVGYASNLSFISRYNIDIMEENTNIIGCGAGSVSKIIGKNKFSRIFNFKYPTEYCNNFDSIIERKIHTEDLIKEVFYET